jgi:hypothetical protein
LTNSAWNWALSGYSNLTLTAISPVASMPFQRLWLMIMPANRDNVSHDAGPPCAFIGMCGERGEQGGRKVEFQRSRPGRWRCVVGVLGSGGW